MSDLERFGERDPTYSVWHRTRSTQRFVGAADAFGLGMVDIDAAYWIEYDKGQRRPVMLVETARDVGQAEKPSYVLVALARMCGIRCYTVLYTIADEFNPANRAGEQHHDISSFRIKQRFPVADSSWRDVTPDQWARLLSRIRNEAPPVSIAEPGALPAPLQTASAFSPRTATQMWGAHAEPSDS